MDVGLVCDRCSTASAMGTPRCGRCDESLSLEPEKTETRVGIQALRAPAPPDPAAAVVCGECSAAVPTGQRFCGNCGARVDLSQRRPASAPDKSGRSTAFFSAIQGARARLTVISGEGLDGVSFTLAGSEHLAGRVDCPILFPEDPYLSPVHANFFYRGNQLVVRDEDSVNGVYVRVAGTVPVVEGTRVMVGEQILEIRDLDPVHVREHRGGAGEVRDGEHHLRVEGSQDLGLGLRSPEMHREQVGVRLPRHRVHGPLVVTRRPTVGDRLARDDIRRTAPEGAELHPGQGQRDPFQVRVGRHPASMPVAGGPSLPLRGWALPQRVRRHQPLP